MTGGFKLDFMYKPPKRIDKLSESPCSKCRCKKKCDKKLKNDNGALLIIKDNVFANKNYDFKNCPLWIALNCKDLIDLS